MFKNIKVIVWSKSFKYRQLLKQQTLKHWNQNLIKNLLKFLIKVIILKAAKHQRIIKFDFHKIIIFMYPPNYLWFSIKKKVTNNQSYKEFLLFDQSFSQGAAQQIAPMQNILIPNPEVVAVIQHFGSVRYFRS